MPSSSVEIPAWFKIGRARERTVIVQSGRFMGEGEREIREASLVKSAGFFPGNSYRQG